MTATICPAKITLLATLVLGACAPDSTVDRVLGVDFGDRYVELETRGHYSALDAVQLLQLANLPAAAKTTSGFHLFQVRYETTGLDGEPTLVSGLMAVPDGGVAKGLVSWQHGTNAIRDTAPSSLGSTEGMLLSAFFAGNETMFVAADYIGLGVSEELPPYLHTESTVDSVVDLLSVASLVLEELEGGTETDLALVGFSQGGAVTAGVQRRLQTDNSTGLDLRAAAALAGPFDLRDVSIHYALEKDSTFYLAYVASAYAHIYGEPLSSIIRDPYLEVVPDLFDGDAGYDDFDDFLPEKAAKLYTPQMLDDIGAGRDNWFTAALHDNETYRWVPDTELRLFYGEDDTDVSPEDATHAFEWFRDNGGNASIVNVGPHDHNAMVVVGLPYVQKWFDQQLEEQP